MTFDYFYFRHCHPLRQIRRPIQKHGQSEGFGNKDNSLDFAWNFKLLLTKFIFSRSVTVGSQINL
jgi:hypothetical protein